MSLIETALGKLRAAESASLAKAAVVPPPVGSLAAPAELSAHALPAGPVDSGKLIEIDRMALRQSGFLPETASERRMADQYRQIKRPLLAQALDSAAPNRRLILMASALPGDGKTFTSINLALSLSRERDVNVLLVDADAAKPHVSRLFGAAGEPGLLDALADPSVNVESLILRTDVRGLCLLPAGRPRDGATELLSSARMAEIGRILLVRDPRRIVLLDSSPLLVTSESRPLIDIAGQVILVVRAGETPKQAVMDAAALFDEGKSVGVVLNQAQASLSESYYGYGTYGDDTSPAG